MEQVLNEIFSVVLFERATIELVFSAGIALMAGFFGFAITVLFFEQRERRDVRGRIKKMAGSLSQQEVSNVMLECGGLGVSVILFVLDCSVSQSQKPLHPFVRFLWGFGLQNSEMLIEKAGLAEVVTKEGIIRARFRLSLIGMVSGFLVGFCISELMALILMVVLFGIGYGLVVKSLKEEMKERVFCAEKQLSEMIEIIILGLRSGLSFDRSLLFYCERFDGSLSRAMSLALHQWTYGLITRTQGLKQVANSYDSTLFQRTFESVNRSLQFGTSLTESLHLSAAEARSVRKTKLEERVAKAPVKMLIPVGALILPAMLILIVGPILLDLMNGF
ncbi:MAG: type II secretion system F family protein [Anaerotardibacter sp.]